MADRKRGFGAWTRDLCLAPLALGVALGACGERDQPLPCSRTPEECRQLGRQTVADVALMGVPGGVVVKGAAAGESLLGRIIGWLFGRGAAEGSSGGSAAHSERREPRLRAEVFGEARP